MKFLNIIIIIFLSSISVIKAEIKQIQTLDALQKGGNLIFIRHAYAPGGGDPNNFNINDCSTQRNLSELGREQSKKIGTFFVSNKIPIDLVISSEWCRCKETALIAFNEFKTKNFLNSFFSNKFAKNKAKQIKSLKTFVNNWNSDKNLVLVTHYVVISTLLDYAPDSGEIVISDKNFKIIGNVEINY